PVHTFPYGGIGPGSYADTLVEAYGLKFFLYVQFPYWGDLSSIWVTDGSDSGTHEVYADPDISSTPISQLTSVCGQVFCEVRTGYDGEDRNLWTVNQDTAYDMNLFANMYEEPTIFFADDSVIFLTISGDSNRELYKLQVCGVFTPTQNISTINSLLLFPNPNDGLFNLVLPDDLSSAEVRVSDMMGKCRYTNKISASQDRKLNLQLENIPPGVYSLQIISSEQRWQQIFIKQ
ncbi:MAG TPA: T9SS type A sorting domain-containing protein, partial [Chitinophagales bacterium]|nr:T9SS type A sorting domain-containing protein [Chitinophagales bacterium]